MRREIDLPTFRGRICNLACARRSEHYQEHATAQDEQRHELQGDTTIARHRSPETALGGTPQLTFYIRYGREAIERRVYPTLCGGDWARAMPS